MIQKLATKAESKAEQDNILKLQTYDSSAFIGQSYFINDRSQNFLIFQPIFNTSTMAAGLTDTIVDWKSRDLPNKRIKPHITPNHSLSPKLTWMNNSKIKVRFKGSYLKQDKTSFTLRHVVNLFIAYKSDALLRDLNTIFTRKDYFLGAVKIAKDNDADQYSFLGYGIAVDSRSLSSILNS